MQAFVRRRRYVWIVIAVIAAAIAVIYFIDAFMTGFTVEGDGIVPYIETELAERYHIDADSLTESERASEGRNVSYVFKFAREAEGEGYLAAAFTKSIFLNRYKNTDMVLIPEYADENDSGVLLSQGYVKTYVYDIHDMRLNRVDSFSHIYWTGPVIAGALVFIWCIAIRIYTRRKQQRDLQGTADTIEGEW